MEWLAPLRDMFTAFLPVLDKVPFIRAVISIGLVFFLPGFAWTLVFFRGGQINILERLALSVGLSIALVTLSVLAFNYVFGVSITGFNSVLIILAVTAVPLACYGLRWLIRRRAESG